MTPIDAFFSHWYFHFPNLILAALSYSLIGRYILELLFSKRPDAVILKVFRQITQPVVSGVRGITPPSCRMGLSSSSPSSGSRWPACSSI